jgi:hypothetical protein
MFDSAFKSVSDSAFDSAFDLGIGLIISDVVDLVGLAASSALLKITFRLIRTTFLIRFYSLNMVVALYSNNYSFSNRGAILLSFLICGLSAYAAHPKVLIYL